MDFDRNNDGSKVDHGWYSVEPHPSDAGGTFAAQPFLLENAPMEKKVC